MVSRVLCIRHGKPENGSYAEDALRPLSDEGKKIQRHVNQKLLASGIKADLILTSPLLRARQTADVINEAFGVQVLEEKALGNEFNEEVLIRKIPDPKKNQTIIFVGHAPTLAEFVNRLTGENSLAAGLSKSACAVVEFSEKVILGQGEFTAYITP